MTIKWSYRAQQQQDNTADYIFREFGSKAVVEFYNKLDKIESDLLSFPELGKEEPLLKNRSLKYRSIVVARKNKLIYSIHSDHIRVHALWDTRREPKVQARALK